jgi:hypothetical protein
MRAQESNHLMTFTGGFTFAKSYNLELGYHYRPTHYFGVGGAVGLWKTFSDFGDLLNDISISTEDDYIDILPSQLLNLFCRSWYHISILL